MLHSSGVVVTMVLHGNYAAVTVYASTFHRRRAEGTSDSASQSFSPPHITAEPRPSREDHTPSRDGSSYQHSAATSDGHRASSFLPSSDEHSSDRQCHGWSHTDISSTCEGQSSKKLITSKLVKCESMKVMDDFPYRVIIPPIC